MKKLLLAFGALGAASLAVACSAADTSSSSADAVVSTQVVTRTCNDKFAAPGSAGFESITVSMAGGGSEVSIQSSLAPAGAAPRKASFDALYHPRTHKDSSRYLASGGSAGGEFDFNQVIAQKKLADASATGGDVILYLSAGDRSEQKWFACGAASSVTGAPAPAAPADFVASLEAGVRGTNFTSESDSEPKVISATFAGNAISADDVRAALKSQIEAYAQTYSAGWKMPTDNGAERVTERKLSEFAEGFGDEEDDLKLKAAFSKMGDKLEHATVFAFGKVQVVYVVVGRSGDKLVAITAYAVET